MHVKVKDEVVTERIINGKKGQMVLRSQRAALDQGGGYEQPFRVELGTGPVYPVGSYDISPESFQLNPYGDLQLGRVKLIVVKAAAPQPVKA